MRYVVGDTVTLTLTFADSDGTLGDPSDIDLVVTDPLGVQTTYVYSDGDLTRVSTGVYTIPITADSAGTWSFVCTATGTLAGVQDGTFDIDSTAPETPGLYCTLEELKTQKGIPDTADDARLARAIGAASRMIDNACGWRFWKDSTAVARFFVPDNPRCLYLLDDPQGPGIATTAGLVVALDYDDTGTYETTLTINTDFYLEPRNAAAQNPARPFTEIVLSGLNYWYPRSMYGRALVSVTAKWGWPTVPDDISEACAIQAGDIAKSSQVSFGVAALANLDGIGMRAQAWNPEAFALIRPYQKPGVG